MISPSGSRSQISKGICEMDSDSNLTAQNTGVNPIAVFLFTIAPLFEFPKNILGSMYDARFSVFPVKILVNLSNIPMSSYLVLIYKNKKTKRTRLKTSSLLLKFGVLECASAIISLNLYEYTPSMLLVVKSV